MQSITSKVDITHRVDPNGDTLLTLRNPNAPFGGDATIWPNTLPKYRTEKLRRNERELKLLAQAKQSTPDNPREIRFQLSSKHLTLTSGYFKALMANNWKEASSSHDFAYSVIAEDWDEGALLVVMMILHCQTSHLPREIGSESLAKIAVIVDYYQCRKAVDFYAETWMRNLNHSELTSCGYGRKLLLRLFGSFFFFNAVDFGRCTQIIIRESRGPIHSLGLPFPQNIIDALEKRRKRCVSKIIAELHKRIKEFRKGNGPCSSDCSSAFVGVLVDTMKAMKLFEPRPAPPFVGYSFAAIEKGILKTQWPKCVLNPTSEHKLQFRKCCAAEDFGYIFKDHSNRISGLRLGTFVDVSRKTSKVAFL